MPKKQEIDVKDNVPEKIKIDYDNIDVKDIMAQIKKRISLAPEPPSEPENDQPETSGYVPYYTSEPVDNDRKARLKKILLKLMKPFYPIIKLLVYPVVSPIQKELDKTNRRLERIKEYTKLLHVLSHNMVVEMTKLKIEEENIKLKIRIMEKDFEFLGRKEKALEKEIYK